MFDLSSILNFLFVDIITIGLITMATIYVIIWLLSVKREGIDLTILDICKKRLKTLFFPILGSINDSSLIFIILLSASLLGFIINLVSDEILDTDAIVSYIPYIKDVDSWDIRGVKSWKEKWSPWDMWRKEDAIKAQEVATLREGLTDEQKGTMEKHFASFKILKDLDRLNQSRYWCRRPSKARCLDEIYEPFCNIKKYIGKYDKKVNNILGNMIKHIESSIEEKKKKYENAQYKIEYKCIKNSEGNEEEKNKICDNLESLEGFLKKELEYPVTGFVQSAFARILRENKSSAVNLLKGELITIKVLRVLFLDCFLIFISSVLGLLLEMLYRILRMTKSYYTGTPGAGNKSIPLKIFRNPMGRRVAIVIISPCLLIFMLRLWTDQSERYYRKLIHAYLATYELPLKSKK